MTLVVADTSPLNYLILIDAIDVLPRLYGVIVVPEQVIVELVDPAAPDGVRTWASSLPSWIDVREVVVASEEMRHLDPGERAAILLAQSEADALLLIDETAGRIEASRRGIRNTGTLGVLRAAAATNHVDLATALTRLLETNFRVSTDLVWRRGRRASRCLVGYSAPCSPRTPSAAAFNIALVFPLSALFVGRFAPTMSGRSIAGPLRRLSP